VHPKIKQERSRRLLELSDRKTAAFYQSQIGTTHQVLFEHTKRGNKMYGFTENYLKVEAEYAISRINQLETVTLAGFNKENTTMIL
jgi:threonylcarbamoyladenosine tRNA methylthiotransferase MtaB